MKRTFKYLLIIILLPFYGQCQTEYTHYSTCYMPANNIDSVIIECIDLDIMTFVNIQPAVFDKLFLETTKKRIISNKDTIVSLMNCINGNMSASKSDGIDTRGKVVIHYSEHKPDTLYYGSTDIFFRDKYLLITKCLQDIVKSINASLFKSDY